MSWRSSAVVLLTSCLSLCCSNAPSDSDAGHPPPGQSGDGGDGGGPAPDAGAADGGTATDGGSGGGSDGGDGGSAAGGTDGGGALAEAQARAWAEAYRTAHPGNGGKDWDIISCCSGASRTEVDLQQDADAVRLRLICGAGQLPVIPLLAWEYGGADHPWINPQASALAYCVYVPTQANSSHWQYDATADHIAADVYVRFPDENPCNSQPGIDQVLACLGDSTNIEVLVDTASFHDGADVGLSLGNSSS